MNLMQLGIALGLATACCTVQAAQLGDSQMEELVRLSARFETEMIRVNGVAAGLPLRNRLDRKVERALHLLEREARAFHGAVVAYFDRPWQLGSAFERLHRAGEAAAKLVAARGAHKELKERWPALAALLREIASFRASTPAAQRTDGATSRGATR